MAETCLFILHFRDKAAVERAFSLVSDDERVLSCIVEAEERRIRFVATPGTGTPLLERVYHQCRMTWCSRHGLGQAPEPG